MLRVLVGGLKRMQTAMLIIFLLFVMASTSRDITTDTVYGLLGEEVVLTPEPISEEITSILWKCGDNKVAEWETVMANPEYYRDFKTRTSLNRVNGKMTIRNLTETDSQFYSAQINDKEPAKRSQLHVINRVSKPNLTQTCNDSMCTLSCKGEITTEDQYAWREGEGEWETLKGKEDKWEVWKSDERLDKSFTCNHSNPLSYAVSDPIIPFPSGTLVTIICSIMAILFGILAPSCIMYMIWKRKGSYVLPASTEEDESPWREEDDHAEEGPNEEETQSKFLRSKDGEDSATNTV
ncbi:hypothetical protein AAFF_G00193380 [Aldrovandia affinis]|uniref:Uncharacterized protein n=1 Tax=Aldrovandia affinis TaxID=143900 RepID=A0AAD7SX68_9TELE|nr:hypothetical protein AAFF_G00193380 [Aldrovandia affinis]